MDWPQIVVGLLNALVVGLVTLLARSMRRIRSNDLHHLQASLDRIERKLDAHITYHLERGS